MLFTFWSIFHFYWRFLCIKIVFYSFIIFTLLTILCVPKVSWPFTLKYLSIYLSSIYLSIYLSFFLSIYLSIYLSFFLSIYLSISLAIYLSIYLSICLPINLSIYLHKKRIRSVSGGTKRTILRLWNFSLLPP